MNHEAASFGLKMDTLKNTRSLLAFRAQSKSIEKQDEMAFGLLIESFQDTKAHLGRCNAKT